jgi:hypothetical protein
VQNITILILSCLFTGWGEHKEIYRGLDAGEDMSGIPQNLIFYEIVYFVYFSSSQSHGSLRYVPCS